MDLRTRQVELPTGVTVPWVARGDPIPDGFRATLVRESGKVPAHVWVETFRGLLDDDTAHRLGGITCPTRVFWGDADAYLSREDQQRLAASIPGAELVVRQGLGHVLSWEDPRRTAEDLLELVAEVTGTAAG